MGVATQPKYKFVSSELKKRILAGNFTPGQRLPSEIELAREFGVSRVITRQAVQMLEREGYVSRKKGSGTFVNELTPDFKPIHKLRQLGFVLIDASASHDYYIWELQAADRWLSKHKISLSIGTITTEELISGRLPTVLEHSGVQGVLFDGVVQNFHKTIAEKVGIPYLIVGNHNISDELPQIKFDCLGVGERATEFLHSVSGGKAVATLIEPFRLHFTKEIFEGYSRAVAEIGQGRSILQTCPDNNGYEGVKRLFEQGYRDIAILTTDRICSGVLHFLREQGRTVEDNPVLVIGNPHRIQEWERKQIYLAPLTAERVVLEAVRVFKECYERGVFDGVNILLKVQIEGRDGEQVEESGSLNGRDLDEEKLWGGGGSAQRREVKRKMEKVLGKELADKLRREAMRKIEERES